MAKSTITLEVVGKYKGDGLKAASDALGHLKSTAVGSAKQVASSLTRAQQSSERMAQSIASTSKSTSASMMELGNKIVFAGGRIYDTSEKIANMGKSLTKGVTVPMVAIGAYAGKAAVEYDTAMADLRKTTNMTKGELERFGEAALQMSTKQPVSAESILQVEALGAQLGIGQSKLQDFAQTVTGLDIATNLNADEAATSLARFANITGMAESDYSRFGSTLVDIGNNMATTESEVMALSMRLASAGTQAGLSEAEIMGLAGAMSSLGIKSEMGGSAASQVLVKIAKAVSEGGPKLEAFATTAGMSAQQFADSWKNAPMSALEGLIQGIKKGSDAGKDMNVILAELGITEIRQSDVMRRLAGNADLVSKSVGLANTAWERNSALSNEVDARNESMAARLQVLKNKVDQIAITVGVPLVNGLIAALDAAQPLITGVGNLAQAFADMDESGQRNVLMMGAMAAGAGPLLSVVGSLGKGIGNFVTTIGHGVQAAGVFSDALNTVDGAQMRAYQSTGNTNAMLGLQNNAAAQAAGGVRNYVTVWEDWYTKCKQVPVLEGQIQKSEAQTAALVEKHAAAQQKAAELAAVAVAKRAEAQSNGTKSALKAAEASAKSASAARDHAAALNGSVAASVRNTESLKAEKSAVESQRNALQGTLNGWASLNREQKVSVDGSAKQATAMQKVGDAAKLAGTNILSFGKNLLLASAGTAAVALIGAAIGEVARQMQEAKAHQDLLNASQQTFGDIAASAAASAEGEAKGMGSLSDSIKDTMQGLADLNKKAGETMTEFSTNSATVDQYVKTIENLRDQGSLTATQQEQLKLAVQGYNDATGASLQVTDAAKGALSMSSQELAKNTEEWKRNAKAQALQELGIEYTKKQVEAQMDLERAQDSVSKAQQRVDEAQRKYNEAKKDGILASMDESRALGEAQAELNSNKKTLEEAQGTYESATQSVADITTELAKNGEAYKALSDTLAGMGDATAALEEAGVNVDDFAGKLAAAGVSSEQLLAVGPRMSELAATFGGNLDMMVFAIQNYNSVPIINKDGTVNVNDASLVDAQGNVWTWNGSAFVSKTSSALVKDQQLRDAQGRVYTWNGTQLVSKDATAKVDSESVDQGNKRKDTNNKTKLKNDNAKAEVKSDSVKTATDRNKRYNDNPPKNFSATSTVTHYENTIKTVTVHKNEMATGGVRYHANGGIATRATVLTKDIVGEAGAEAIVPLTNSRYAMPFVRMIAHETVQRIGSGERGGGNTYVLNLNGVNQRPSQKAERLIEALVDEFNTTNRAGAF